MQIYCVSKCSQKNELVAAKLMKKLAVTYNIKANIFCAIRFLYILKLCLYFNICHSKKKKNVTVSRTANTSET